MPRTQLRGEAGCRAADGNDNNPGRRHELVNNIGESSLQRSNQHLGVDTRCNDQLGVGVEVISQRGDGALVLVVTRVEKRDDHVRVDGYLRHSPRSSSRCPRGYVPAGRLPA